MREVEFRQGETLFREGDASEQCFKILSGSVEIRVGLAGLMRRDRSERIAVCGPGELIGEMSVIDKAPRSATAIALERTRCLAFTEAEIIEVLENDPQEALSYVRTLIHRLRHSNKQISMSAARRG